MGFLMYVKHMEGVKLPPPQSKILKNDAKKLKLTPKPKNIKNFPKYQEKVFLITILSKVSTFLLKNFRK